MIHLGKLHLIHALACVPVEEGLAPEHGGELLRDSLEQLLRRDTFIHRTHTQGPIIITLNKAGEDLDCCRIANESRGHLETSWRDVTHGSLDVIGNPLRGG